MSEIINYPPNSHKSKAEEATEQTKRVEKVVTGPVKIKKKSEVRKLADVFVADDIGNVKDYIVKELLVPTIKNTISNIVRDGIDMLLFGSPRRDNKPRGAIGHVDYTKYSRDEPRSVNTSRPAAYRHEDIVVDTRGEAEDVITQMEAVIDTYGSVSVGDLYDLVGISGNYTDHKYGWTNLHNAQPVRVRDGYMISLPKAIPLPK
jgi:hypothetical protein